MAPHQQHNWRRWWRAFPAASTYRLHAARPPWWMGTMTSRYCWPGSHAGGPWRRHRCRRGSPASAPAAALRRAGPSMPIPGPGAWQFHVLLFLLGTWWLLSPPKLAWWGKECSYYATLSTANKPTEKGWWYSRGSEAPVRPTPFAADALDFLLCIFSSTSLPSRYRILATDCLRNNCLPLLYFTRLWPQPGTEQDHTSSEVWIGLT